MASSFEFRREEIGLIEGRDPKAICDDEVLDSFLHNICHLSGAQRQYLEHGSVAARIGNTIFVHGALDENSAGFVPPLGVKFGIPETKEPGRFCESVDEWIAAMNSFLRAGLDDFARRPDWNSTRSSRGGEALMALQNRESMCGRTVVSCCYGDGGVITTDAALAHRKQALEQLAQDNDVKHYSGLCSNPRNPHVNDWLTRSGVHRVVVGHKPTGDCPAVLAGHTNEGVEVVSCDTSFSDTLAKDMRGVAVSSVTIIGSSGHSHLHVAGVLRDGVKHSGIYRPVGVNPLPRSGDPLLGTVDDEGWWFKARISADQDHSDPSVVTYRQTRGTGRKWETRDVRVPPTSNHL